MLERIPEPYSPGAAPTDQEAAIANSYKLLGLLEVCQHSADNIDDKTAGNPPPDSFTSP